MSEAVKLDDLEVDLNYEQTPVISSQDLAEGHLRYLAHWQRQRQEREDHARQQIEKVQLWLEREQERIDCKIHWHEEGLKAFLWQSGKKSIRLIHGTLRRLQGRERIEITDEATFLAQAPANLITERLIRTPDKKAILNHIHLTGEIPPGTDLVRGEDTLHIDTKE